MASEAENIVNEFCTATSRKNLDELVSQLFHRRRRYHNVMTLPSKGTAAIRAAIRGIHG